jgi:uncharacterized protein
MLETGTLRVLTRHECMDLLGETRVGRVAFVDRALPAVEPVAFEVDGDDVLVRAGAGSALPRAHNTVVAFEADDIVAGQDHGWTVCCVGTAEVDAGPAAQAGASARRKSPPGAATPVVRIRTGIVAGRRFTTPSRHGVRPSDTETEHPARRRTEDPRPYRGRSPSRYTGSQRPQHDGDGLR